MKSFIVLLVFVSLFGCCSKEVIVDDDFINDLSSENYRIAGVLYFDVYHKNLDTLSYESYLNYLRLNEAPAAKGLYDKIVKSKDHYFKTKKYSFLLTLFYANENVIVCDKSSTSFIDSVHFYKTNEPVPNIKMFSDLIIF